MNLTETHLTEPQALYPWHYQAWQQIQQFRERWPHAILLHGPQGIGKKVFAEWLAQSLLCEAPQTDGQACTKCVSCGWFSQYNHPDYRRLLPENLELEGAEPVGEEGDDAKASTQAAGKPSKTPSKEIVINQVRQLSDWMTISTHRQGKRIIVIYPAQAMNIAASNALLKSLEEPGPNTIFILVTSSTDSLLATLVSRCQQFSLALPDRELALAWLVQQNVPEPEQFLAEQGGAPLAALASFQSDVREQQHEFLRQLQHINIDIALKMADKLHKTSILLVLTWMQRWLYDIFCCKLAGKIRYYPQYHKEIKAVAELINLSSLLKLIDTNTQRRAVAEHPLSAKLVLEEMLLDYIESYAHVHERTFK